MSEPATALCKDAACGSTDPPTCQLWGSSNRNSSHNIKNSNSYSKNSTNNRAVISRQLARTLQAGAAEPGARAPRGYLNQFSLTNSARSNPIVVFRVCGCSLGDVPRPSNPSPF